jgi:hypothetical protein
MAKRVNLDAMIPRADFAQTEESYAIDLIKDFPVSHLSSDSPILKLLRKPDFQRETNHWSADQIATFVASFLDSEVIPSLILWKSPTYIFVIDGGHRLSALRAWMEDDYGDGATSLSFYGGEISEDQRKVAKRTRKLVEERIGRYSKLRSHVDSPVAEQLGRRARVLVTRGLSLQWVQGSPAVAETSFFKINSQGTPLDEVEEMLIQNRRKPIAIAARAILRGGGGHKYWSSFSGEMAAEIEKVSEDFYKLLFEPETEPPIKTLDVPLGGSVSPVDALGLLVEFLTIAANRGSEVKLIDAYDDDSSGESTVGVLKHSLQVLNRITGNDKGSLGLHPAVYFYNEKGKYSRFLYLGMISLITEKLRNNDHQFFKKFTRSRSKLEQFLITNKSLIGIVLQNLGKTQRVPKIRDLFTFLVQEFLTKDLVEPESAMAHIGVSGRIVDVKAMQSNPQISDDTKSMVFVREALKSALRCPICNGLLNPIKSVSYDHKVKVVDGGAGTVSNTQLTHPYCNHAREALVAESSS